MVRFLPGFVAVLMLAGGMAQAAEEARPVVKTDLESSDTTYKVTLVGSHNNMFASAEGVLTDRSELTCDGFKSQQRMIVQIVPSNGGRPLVLRTGSDTMESANGLQYDFVTKTSMNGRLVEDKQGQATLDAPGASGLATFKDSKPVPIPPGAVFPVTFARSVLAAAGEGRTSYEARVFDGSSEDGTGLKQVSAIIGAPRPVANGAARISTAPGTVSWPVQMSYYAIKEGDSVPLMQNGFSLLPNGWTEAMVMDFQQFKLRFDLTEYKPIPAPKCD